MPAAPPLLAHRRVLGAADRRHRPVAGHADVAADALADVLEPPLLDLQRQERVGDRRAGGADQVEDAVSDEPHHRVGRGQPPDPTTGFDVSALIPRKCSSVHASSPNRDGERVVLPDADHHVPQVGQLADQLEQRRRCRPRWIPSAPCSSSTTIRQATAARPSHLLAACPRAPRAAGAHGSRGDRRSRRRAGSSAARGSAGASRGRAPRRHRRGRSPPCSDRRDRRAVPAAQVGDVLGASSRRAWTGSCP